MKQFISLILTLIISLQLSAQAPQKMSYQCVIRNTNNMLLPNTAVGMKVSILQTSPTGTLVYAESHNTTTNINGLASLEVGGGLPLTGTFASINWANGTYYIKTETDPTGGTNYSITGSSQLLSVPYALYAETANVPGVPGPQGPAGNNGATGPQGAMGPIGTTGATGAMGPQGPDGANGNDGATGAMGPQGAQGPDGANGNDGAIGAMGPEGPIGPQGLDGENGNDGATGAQGPAGNDGATGATGATGPQGPIGATGPAGPGGTRSIVIPITSLNSSFFPAGVVFTHINFGAPCIRIPDGGWYDINFSYPVPTGFNFATASFKVYYTSPNTGGVFNCGAPARGYTAGSGPAIGFLFGGGGMVMPQPTNANEVMVATSDLGNSGAGNNLISVLLRRRGDLAADTAIGDLNLLGFVVEWTE